MCGMGVSSFEWVVSVCEFISALMEFLNVVSRTCEGSHLIEFVMSHL